MATWMNREEAIGFALASAASAIDAWRDYGSVEESIDSNRQNVADTVNEYGANAHLLAAIDAYDAHIAALLEKL